MSAQLSRVMLAFLLILLAFCSPLKAQVSPISGLGSIQLLDNTGAPATSGCFYFYAAGTSTQQATFTDSTGLTQNTNPLCLGSGARATGVWLTTSQFYKITACLNNDGPTCNASDILWSQDQVPGGSSSSGAASCASGCTGFFVSGSATPATSGTLRLASGDSFGWRNAAGSANLLVSKDSNDLLSWAGGSLKFPEVGAPAPVASFDILTANNTLHRWQMGNNGAALDTVVGAATVDTLTNKTYNAQGSGNNFQIGGISISATGQSSSTFLKGDGTWAGVTTYFLQGSGSGTYTGTNVTYANVDTTNLCKVVTVPTGSKLVISASGAFGVQAGPVSVNVALTDIGATCGGAGTTVLKQASITQPFGTAADFTSFALNYVLTGDGNAHSISLQAETTNASDTWQMQNSSVSNSPGITLQLVVSN